MSTTATKRAPTIGSLADKMWDLKQRKKTEDAIVKATAKEIEELEEVILGMLDSQDTRKGEGKKASISLSSSIQSTTEDWQAFMEFVAAGKRNDKKAYLHLVQKRVSVEAYRELLGLGVNVPGLKPFTKRTLNVTKVNE